MIIMLFFRNSCSASISKESFYECHPACITIIKNRLTPGHTAMLSGSLCEEFNDHLESLGSEGAGQLNELIKYSLSNINYLDCADIHLRE